MRHKKTFLISLFLSSVLIIIVLDPELFATLLQRMINFIVCTSDTLRENIGWAATALSLIMYAKLRFFDARLFQQMQKTYGKHRFLVSLEVVNEALMYISPEELINSILATNRVAIDMKASLVKLKRIMGEEEPQEQDLKLSKKQEKKLRREIKRLLKIIDKQIEVGTMIEEKNLSVRSITEGVKKRQKLEEIDKKLRNRGRHKVQKLHKRA